MVGRCVWFDVRKGFGFIETDQGPDVFVHYSKILAEPGEFTKRAFLNGRIDLSQAESVLDIVQAKTEQTLKLALKTLRGKLLNYILSIRGKMIDILSFLEAEIDFSEEEIETNSKKEKAIDKLIQEIKSLLEKA